MRTIRTVAAAIALTVLFPVAVAAGLVDQRGDAFSLGSASGPVVLTFVSTRLHRRVSDCERRVIGGALRGEARERVRGTFVTATLDPAYDTPFVMSSYARHFDTDGGRWRFVSGTTPSVRALMHEFRVTGDADEHSSFIYVVSGQSVQTLPLSSDAPTRIVGILKKAVLDAQSSRSFVVAVGRGMRRRQFLSFDR